MAPVGAQATTTVAVPAAPPPPPVAGGAPRRGLPAEVVVVAVALLALAGLVLYPVIRYGGPLIPDVASDSTFARAVATLLLELLAVTAAAGGALVALAVGLLRGSRVSQWLTCVFCGLVSISEIVAAQQDGLSVSRVQGGIAAAVTAVAALIIALVTLMPGAREFFAADRRPVGVLLAAAVSVYLGCVGVLDAVLLSVSGSLETKYVGYGIAYGVIALGLLALARPLRAGNRPAAAGIALLLAGFLVPSVLLAKQEQATSGPGVLVPAGMVVAAIIGLALPEASRRHFSEPQPPSRLSGGGVAAWIAVAVAVVASGAFGIHVANVGSASDSYQPASVSVAEPNQGVVAPEPTAVSDTELTADQAQSVAQQTLNSLEGGGDVNVCDGSLPSLAITDYSIGDVTPATQGSYAVTATVTMADGSTQDVTYTVTSDSSGDPCVEADTLQTQPQAQPTPPPSAAAAVPADVPDVPTSTDPVPTDATPPGQPQSSEVIPYTDSGDVPTSTEQIVEYQPADLSGYDAGAVRQVIAFMTQVNRQDFQSAWNATTLGMDGSVVTADFANDYRTSHFMQVAFGQPRDLGDGLVAVPSRWVSRQDPAAQGSPAGVTACSYWPQFVFLVAHRDGQWWVSRNGAYESRPQVADLKRPSDSGQVLNPVDQRVAC